MLSADVVKNFRVVNHEPENPDALVQVGMTRTGRPALITETPKAKPKTQNSKLKTQNP
jgi:nickel-dependent lactate racemase